MILLIQKAKWLSIPILLGLLYFLGPKTNTPRLPVPLPLEKGKVAYPLKTEIKAGNESVRLYAHADSSKTQYVVLYLHGFSSCPREGRPFFDSIGKAIGANVYAPLLYAHGLRDSIPMAAFSVDSLWLSAQEAYLEAFTMGDSIILAGTSTGGSLAMLLASRYPKIKAVLALSPNVEINDPFAFLSNNPWGQYLVNAVVGPIYKAPVPEAHKPWWYAQYDSKAIPQLQAFLETAMIEETFEKIKVPLWMGLYYKDEKNQDPIIRVSASEKAFESCMSKEKKLVLFPEAKDHVIGCDLKSDAVDEVIESSIVFLAPLLKP
jgi:esterase/lipase